MVIPKMKPIKFESLPEMKIEHIPSSYQVIQDDIQFDFYCDIKKNSKYLQVWWGGAIDRIKLKLPVFNRWTYTNNTKDSVIIFNDSTLYLEDNLRLGWSVGTSKQDYMPYYKNIILNILKSLSFNTSQLLLFGSSAGGFASLMMAGRIKNSIAVVNNPQTNILKYHKGHLNEFLEVCFNDIPISELESKYINRFSVSDFYKSINYCPRIYYLQNIYDTFHYENHYKPFIKNHKSVVTNLYHEKKDKPHNPISMIQTLKAIEKGKFLLKRKG